MIYSHCLRKYHFGWSFDGVMIVRHDPEWIVDELGCRFTTFGFSLGSRASNN